MSQSRLRPRFKIISDLSVGEIQNKIDLNLKKTSIPIEGQVVQQHAFIRIPQKDQHYWSPELHVWVRDQDGKTIIYGVVGPKPTIWTMFMFFYGLVLSTSFFGSIYGMIQWYLDMDAPFLWSIPLGIVGIFIVFMAARYGKWKGREQMKLHKAFIDESLKD